MYSSPFHITCNYYGSEFLDVKHACPGTVMYDGVQKRMVAWTGSYWEPLEFTPTVVTLDQSEVNQVRELLRREAELQELKHRYPALQQAHDDFLAVRALVSD